MKQLIAKVRQWKWPLVWRSTLERESKEFSYRMGMALANHRAEEDRLHQVVGEVMRKLVEIDPLHNPEERNFELHVRFFDSLVFSMSQWERSYVSYAIRSLCHELERELLTMNFDKFRENWVKRKREEEMRRYRTPWDWTPREDCTT